MDWIVLLISQSVLSSHFIVQIYVSFQKFRGQMLIVFIMSVTFVTGMQIGVYGKDKFLQEKQMLESYLRNSAMIGIFMIIWFLIIWV